MADKPEDKKPKKGLSDETVQRVRAHIIHGGVGYGRPPKEHQFKKGQRANPNGRPKTAPPDLSLSDQPFLEAVYKGVGKKIPLKENGVVRQVPRREALFESVYVGAVVDRNARSQGLAADWIRQADEARARDIRENQEWWSTYQSIIRLAIAEAQKNGEPPPEFLPHPDDLVFVPGEMTRIIGPFDDESAARTQKVIAFRDALILQAALDEKLDTTEEAADPLDSPGTAYVFAVLIDQILPPRLRLSDEVIFRQVDRHSRHPSRWLLKEVYGRWRRQGIRAKRGLVFPPMRWAVRKANMIGDLLAALREGRLDLNRIIDGDLDGLVALLELRET